MYISDLTDMKCSSTIQNIDNRSKRKFLIQPKSISGLKLKKIFMAVLRTIRSCPIRQPFPFHLGGEYNHVDDKTEI